MTLYFSLLEHSLTRLALFSSEKGLRSVHFIPQNVPLPDPGMFYPNADLQPDQHHHSALIQQLNLYLDGVPVDFTVPMDLSGTPFQLRVWDAIATIPFGQTRTYGEIAAQVGSPNGSRAVGGATGRNPIPIIIP